MTFVIFLSINFDMFGDSGIFATFCLGLWFGLNHLLTQSQPISSSSLPSSFPNTSSFIENGGGNGKLKLQAQVLLQIHHSTPNSKRRHWFKLVIVLALLSNFISINFREKVRFLSHILVYNYLGLLEMNSYHFSMYACFWFESNWRKTPVFSVLGEFLGLGRSGGKATSVLGCSAYV